MTRQPPDSGTVKRNRLLAFGIMLLPVMVISAASLLWLAVKSGRIDIVGSLGTHNKGRLLTPVREFESIEVLGADGQPFHYSEQPGKWTLLIPGDTSCDESCRQTLWLTRQLHTALGRRAVHLRRYYLSNSWPLEPELAAFLAAEYPGLQLLSGGFADINRLLAAPDGSRQPLPNHLYYLIDKRGFVMMEYGPSNSGKDVIADVKFLMKQLGDE
jgi:hypothetical protein